MLSVPMLLYYLYCKGVNHTLANIMNVSLQTGAFALKLKHQNVISVYKKGNETAVNRASNFVLHMITTMLISGWFSVLLFIMFLF